MTAPLGPGLTAGLTRRSQHQQQHRAAKRENKRRTTSCAYVCRGGRGEKGDVMLVYKQNTRLNYNFYEMRERRGYLYENRVDMQ